MALSGGVDSSVAAALLVKAGYAVTAAFMINYDEPTPTREHCWVPDYRDAVRVAAKLCIPILKLDFTKEYREMVLAYMYAEYEAGRTPNPDIMCNKFVKFGSWLHKARELGFDFLATGHYARVKKITNNKKQLTTNNALANELSLVNCSLLISKDTNKDQTYFLHQLTQQQLQYTMFPIGEYTKPEVRKLAKKFNLPTAEKEESMGICFIGEVPMKEFLEKRIAHKPGKIVLVDGTVVGEHDGLAFYTIGERHIGVKERDAKNKAEANQALYVIEKRMQTNELVVGHENSPLLYTKKITLTNVNWINGQVLQFPLKCEVRLRHRQEMQGCVVTMGNSVEFDDPQRAVTPGQFAVFYKKGECLGGGIIQ